MQAAAAAQLQHGEPAVLLGADELHQLGDVRAMMHGAQQLVAAARRGDPAACASMNAAALAAEQLDLLG
jgi:hypothetical protein